MSKPATQKMTAVPMTTGVQAKLPPSGEFTERGASQIYCAPCCDAQIRLKRANEGTRPLPSERNGPAISALTGLTGKQAALA